MSFNLMNGMSIELNGTKTLTENGAVAYASSGKEALDFFYAVSALRKSNEDVIQNQFTKVYYENPLNAWLLSFFLRDVRGGNGERKIFRACLKWLAENKPDATRNVISLVGEYGRFDDLWCLLDTNLKNDVCDFVKHQLEFDIENAENGKAVSLLAKWLPSENASSKETKRYAGVIRTSLGLTSRQYRKTLTRLRQYLDIVESKMSSKNWGEIDYSSVPSQANLKYNSAFLRNDEERRRAYLESLKKGETKINAKVLQPHEIVRAYNPTSTGWGDFGGSTVKPYDETLEQLWKALPDITVGNCLVVRDGSGSMTWGYDKVRPLDIASSLAIYMAEHNTGVWKDKFITFGNRPQIVSLENCNWLRDKLLVAYKYADCSNTNIEATMMLILNTAVKNHCSQEDMPESIVIVSDMRFDQGCERANQSLFDSISERFEAYGYHMPKIVFWNVNEAMSKQTVPMQRNELGVVLMSGYSTQLMKMIMSGETDPYKVLLEAINAERYKPVENAVKNCLYEF